MIQSAVGTFMLTATSRASVFHVVPALAGLAAPLLVWLALPDATPAVTGCAFLFATATSVTAFLTGMGTG